jgi:hypothetical protein
LDGMGHFRAGIVCGNSSTMVGRASAPYNEGRMAARTRRESTAKVAAKQSQEQNKHRQLTPQTPEMHGRNRSGRRDK